MGMFILAAMLLWQLAGTPFAPTGVIEGQVFSTDGKPVAGLRVSALYLPESGKKPVSAIAAIGQTDDAGRFRLENVAAGKYHIMAGALDVASYYPGVKTAGKARIVTVAAGATVSGIDFKLARPPGVRVTGFIKGFSQNVPAGLVRALLTSGGGRQPVEVNQTSPVQRDGTFEFVAVFPGRYVVRLASTSSTFQETAKIDVKEETVRLEMKTSLPVLVGHVSVDDGSPLPLLLSPVLTMFNSVMGPQDSSAVRLRFRSTAPASESEKAVLALLTNDAWVRADGYFAFEGIAGDYEPLPQQMPIGYYIKGSHMDRETSRLEVTLTTKPPASEPQGVTVSGRIVGLMSGPAPPKGIRIQTVNRAPSRLTEIPIGADGTFAVRGVPPGAISLTLLTSTNTPPGQALLQMRIDVADRDIALDLSVSSMLTTVEIPGGLK
jgi:hypothetical protein